MTQRVLVLAKYSVFLVISVVAASGVFSARGLYADGPFWLYQILIKSGFYIFDTHRAYAQVLVQLPVVIAIELGVRNLNSLIRIHSFGFICVPLLFWVSALLIQFRTHLFWLIVAAFSVTYLRTGFFAAGEFNTTYGMIALCIALIFKRNCQLIASFALVITSFCLTHSYESMSFLGILLALLALTRLVIDKNDSHHFRIALLLSVLLFSFASFVAIRSMLYLREYDLNATVNLHAFLEFHLNYLIAMCVILFLICCNVSTDKKNFLALASVILSIVYAIYSSRWDKTGISFGFFSYAYRSMGAFMFSGLIALAWLIKYFPKLENHRLFRVDTLRSAVLVSSLFAVTATPMIFHSYGFFAWLKKFENEAIMVDGLVPVDLTSIARNQSSVSGYNWPWTNSTLSVLLRGNAVGIVINGTTFTGWETFDPKTIDKFPLSNYRKDSYFSK